MKNYLLPLFAIAVLVIATTSCDKCKDITCQNGGTCDKGQCTCPTGYSGDNCEIKDPCLGVNCLNSGTCASGTCNCASGYFGTDCGLSCANCSTFTGNYTSYSQNYCGSSTGYTLSITTSTSSSNKISISNFNNKGWAVFGDVSGNSFSIPAQTFIDASTSKSYKVETTSSATISGNTLTIPIKYTDLSTMNPISCSVLLYK